MHGRGEGENFVELYIAYACDVHPRARALPNRALSMTERPVIGADLFNLETG